MFKKITAVVEENREAAKNIFRMVLRCEGADLEHFVPGQFANLEIPGHGELLLKRPISICKADAKAGTVTLFYQVKGKGTEALTVLKSGDEIGAILPVGKGFSLKGSDKNVFLVGGGVGIAPLLSVVRRWPDRNYEAFLGYRGEKYEYCMGDFKDTCGCVHAATDDGTLGEKGLITDVLKERLKHGVPDVVLACGPEPMLRALKSILEPMGIPAQVSMEQRMCCGFGACYVCACGINSESGLEYKKVCTEGPVFDLYEVAL